MQRRRSGPLYDAGERFADVVPKIVDDKARHGDKVDVMPCAGLRILRLDKDRHGRKDHQGHGEIE